MFEYANFTGTRHRYPCGSIRITRHRSRSNHTSEQASKKAGTGALPSLSYTSRLFSNRLAHIRVRSSNDALVHGCDRTTAKFLSSVSNVAFPLSPLPLIPTFPSLQTISTSSSHSKTNSLAFCHFQTHDKSIASMLQACQSTMNIEWH